MKISSGHKLLAAALLAGSAQMGFAATDTSNTPYMGIMGTYLFPDAARQLDKGFGGTLLFGMPVNAYFAPEFNLFGLRANRSIAAGSDTNWGGGLNLNVFPFSRNAAIAPFLMIGGGGEHDQNSAGNNKGYFSGYANAGGGFLVSLNQSHTAALRVEAGRYGIFNDQIEAGRSHVLDTRISAGVQIALGGHLNDAPPPPPPKAAPRDSDGDGVYDDADQCPNTPYGVKVDAKGCPLPLPPPPVAAPVAPKDSDGDGVIDSLDQCPNTPRGMKVDASGCAIKTATIILHDINFETNKAILTAGAKKSLDDVVAGLKGQSSMKLKIEGHTDSTGTPAHNLKLSKERAAAAKRYLVENGVDASRLETEGYGESKPIASNKTKAGRAENRRVEFKVQ